MKALILHGGAGTFRDEKEYNGHSLGIRKALNRGKSVLDDTGSSLETVIESIKVMEEDPTFDCGRGSHLDIHGQIGLDASIMDNELNAGGIAGLKDVLHPIEVARLVMEKTDHVLLAGEGLEEFLDLMEVPRCKDLITPEIMERWENELQRLVKGEAEFFPSARKYYELLRKKKQTYYSTVGAVAIDDSGKLVAGTSTGGAWLRMFGRVGDTPLIGSGTYADKFGGVSLTGHGERIIKLSLARMTVHFMKNHPAQEAIDMAIGLAKETDCECGIIGIDRQGSIGVGYTAKDMSWACIDRSGKVSYHEH